MWEFRTPGSARGTPGNRRSYLDQPANPMPWYSMTAIYHWEQMGSTLPKFERRTTICSVPDEARAIERLLAEAKDYPTSGHIKFLGDYFIQGIDDPPSDEPIEVAHEMSIGVDPNSGRIIEAEEFLEHHWGRSRIESCDTLGFEHVWHNLDGKSSACYNCEEVREGRLWETDAESKLAEQGVGGQPATPPRVGD